MYDPMTARFLQEDTYSGDKNDPLSLNLYAYCNNKPLMYWDPDGHTTVGIYIDGQYMFDGSNTTGNTVVSLSSIVKALKGTIRYNNSTATTSLNGFEHTYDISKTTDFKIRDVISNFGLSPDVKLVVVEEIL